MTTTSSMRRTPQQARGQRRIDTILDAAEQVLAEIGSEAATTNAIAARAHTSIGSLYQFFPNKEAIIQALEQRYVDGLRTVRDALFSPDAASLGLSAWIDRIIDSLAETQARNPGFKAVFCGPLTTPELAAADDQLQREVQQGVDGMFAVWAPEMDPERRGLYVAISITTVKALLPLATEDPRRQDQVMAEIKTLLCAYLDPVFGPKRDQETTLRP